MIDETADGTDETVLRAALAALPARQRQVLSLLYLAGLDELGVSEALGISVKAVKKQVARGRAVLLARLDTMADRSSAVD